MTSPSGGQDPLLDKNKILKFYINKSASYEHLLLFWVPHLLSKLSYPVIRIESEPLTKSLKVHVGLLDLRNNFMCKIRLSWSSGVKIDRGFIIKTRCLVWNWTFLIYLFLKETFLRESFKRKGRGTKPLWKHIIVMSRYFELPTQIYVINKIKTLRKIMLRLLTPPPINIRPPLYHPSFVFLDSFVLNIIYPISEKYRRVKSSKEVSGPGRQHSPSLRLSLTYQNVCENLNTS